MKGENTGDYDYLIKFLALGMVLSRTSCSLLSLSLSLSLFVSLSLSLSVCLSVCLSLSVSLSLSLSLSLFRCRPVDTHVFLLCQLTLFIQC